MTETFPNRSNTPVPKCWTSASNFFIDNSTKKKHIFVLSPIQNKKWHFEHSNITKIYCEIQNIGTGVCRREYANSNKKNQSSATSKL